MLDLWKKIKPSGLPGTMVSQPLICAEGKIYQKILGSVSVLPSNAVKMFDVAVDRITLEECSEKEAVNVTLGTPVYGNGEKLYVERQDGAYDVYCNQEKLDEYNQKNGFIFMVTEKRCQIRLLNGNVVQVENGNVLPHDGQEPTPMNQLIVGSCVAVSEDKNGELHAYLYDDRKQLGKDDERQIYLDGLYVGNMEKAVALPVDVVRVGEVEYDVIKNHEDDLNYFGSAHNVPVGSRIYQKKGDESKVYVEIEKLYYCFERKS